MLPGQDTPASCGRNLFQAPGFSSTTSVSPRLSSSASAQSIRATIDGPGAPCTLALTLSDSETGSKKNACFENVTPSRSRGIAAFMTTRVSSMAGWVVCLKRGNAWAGLDWTRTQTA